MKKKEYLEPMMLAIACFCEAGFAVSSDMDDDSSVKDLGWN